MSRFEEFVKERERLNQLVLEKSGNTIKRFFSLDGQAYREGALPAKTKELLGLVASLVLRCDDCVCYHLVECRKAKVTDQEMEEAVGVALIVGGSIVIPHLRRAFDFWYENMKEEQL